MYCHPQTDCFVVSQLFSVASVHLFTFYTLTDTRVLNSFGEF